MLIGGDGERGAGTAHGYVRKHVLKTETVAPVQQECGMPNATARAHPGGRRGTDLQQLSRDAQQNEEREEQRGPRHEAGGAELEHLVDVHLR